MQLRLDAADRLVELVEERRGPVAADEAARRVFALARTPTALARSLLDETVRDDARLVWRGDAVALAAPLGGDLPLESATYVVVDLETTGLRPGSSRICEIGAVRVRGFELEDEFQTLVNPREPLGAVISALTGLADAQLRRAPPVEVAMRRFLAFAGDAVLVAHNARFDLGFLDRETQRLTGSRIASPVVDTVGLARKLLAGRIARANLGALAYFFGTDVRPCHRALPDAQATAEILVGLLGLAQERGVAAEETGVTLMATEGPRVIVDQLAREPEGLCASLATALESIAHPKQRLAWDGLVVLGPEHGRIFREAGWDRARVRDRLFALTTSPARDIVRGAGGSPEGVEERFVSDPDMPVAKFAAPDRILLAYAGGDAGLFSMVYGSWAAGEIGSAPQSVSVEPWR